MASENICEGRWEHQEIGFRVKVFYVDSREVSYRRLVSGHIVRLSREAFRANFKRPDPDRHLIQIFSTWVDKAPEAWAYFLRERDGLDQYVLLSPLDRVHSYDHTKLLAHYELAESGQRPITGNVWRAKQWRDRREERQVVIVGVSDDGARIRYRSLDGETIYRNSMAEFMQVYEVVARCEIEGPYGTGARASVEGVVAFPSVGEYFLSPASSGLGSTCRPDRTSHQLALGFQALADAMQTDTGERVCREAWMKELIGLCPQGLDPRGWTAVVLWANEPSEPSHIRWASTLRRTLEHKLNWHDPARATRIAHRLLLGSGVDCLTPVYKGVYEAALREPQPVRGPWYYRRPR